MKKLNFFRGVCSAARILSSVMKVLCIIGAVGILFCSLVFLMMPRDLVRIDVSATTVVHLNLKEVLGAEWDSFSEQFLAQFPEGTLTDSGVAVSQETPSVAVDSGAAALSLVPLFVELVILVAFFHLAKKAATQLQEATSPFSLRGASYLRSAAYVYFAAAGVPCVCAWILSMINSSVTLVAELDLFQIIFGFLMLGVAALLEYGADLFPPTGSQSEPPQETPSAF